MSEGLNSPGWHAPNCPLYCVYINIEGCHSFVPRSHSEGPEMKPCHMQQVSANERAAIVAQWEEGYVLLTFDLTFESTNLGACTIQQGLSLYGPRCSYI